MAGIFISYRRDDTRGWAGRLAADLKSELGGVNIFMDIDDIPPGVQWDDYINHTVRRCNVLLALIGPRWLDATDATGGRRIDDPADLVRREIVSALERNLTVVPVLMGDATLPAPKALPEDLKLLLRRQAYELSDTRWKTDCHNLIRTLKPLTRRRAKWWFLATGTAAAVALLLVGATVITEWQRQDASALYRQSEQTRRVPETERRRPESDRYSRLSSLDDETSQRRRRTDVRSRFYDEPRYSRDARGSSERYGLDRRRRTLDDEWARDIRNVKELLDSLGR